MDAVDRPGHPGRRAELDVQGGRHPAVLRLSGTSARVARRVHEREHCGIATGPTRLLDDLLQDRGDVRSPLVRPLLPHEVPRRHVVPRDRGRGRRPARDVLEGSGAAAEEEWRGVPGLVALDHVARRRGPHLVGGELHPGPVDRRRPRNGHLVEPETGHHVRRRCGAGVAELVVGAVRVGEPVLGSAESLQSIVVGRADRQVDRPQRGGLEDADHDVVDVAQLTVPDGEPQRVRARPVERRRGRRRVRRAERDSPRTAHPRPGVGQSLR